MTIFIAKADGSREAFKEEKLDTSLRRAGASKEVAEHIRHKIQAELHDGMTTQEIYSHAFNHLRVLHRQGADPHADAARYSLKRAILEFGPTGFPFESYIEALFEADGYETSVDQIVKGACTEHEVDLVMTKGDLTYYVEAKFHNTLGFKSDLKTALYVQARVEDIIEAGHKNARGLLVTNTKFTDRALQYAQCRHLELLGWDYPQGLTLHERIDKVGLYPVTALTTLSRRQKMALLSERTVLCQELAREPSILSRVGVEGKKANTVLQEVGALCTAGKDI
jgi:hypothetical protein